MAAAVLVLAGCGSSEIQVYNIPKEDAWKLPAGWQEREAGGMRAARFSAPSAGEGDIDVSIIPIRGFGGGVADILNIWRDQMKLERFSDPAEAAKMAEKVVIGGLDSELYDMTSSEAVVNGKDKARTLVGVAKSDSTLWFIKMTGDEAGVGKQKPVFLSFLKSVNFRNIVPPSMNSMAAAGGGPGGNPHEAHGPGDGHNHEGEHDHASHPEWQVPEGWKEVAATSMLNAKFLVTGEAGAKVEVNVSVLAGDGGGLGENLNRWRKQVGLEPWDADAMQKGVTSFDAVGSKGSLVDFQGKDARTGLPSRIIGAVIPMGGQTWFYKLMGDEKVAEREKAAFLKFVSTAKHPNG